MSGQRVASHKTTMDAVSHQPDHFCAGDLSLPHVVWTVTPTHAADGGDERGQRSLVIGMLALH
jgi:hypothetical protein